MVNPPVKTEETTTADGRKVKFIDNYWTFAVAVAFIGPFALPLFWRNPRASNQAKLVVTVLVSVLTAALLWISGKSMKSSYDQVQQIRQMLKESQQQ